MSVGDVLGVGHPDWVLLDPEVGDPFINETATINAEQVYPRVQMSNWEAVQVTLTPSTLALTFEVEASWYSAQVGGVRTGRQVMKAHDGARASHAFPVCGEWCEIRVRAENYAAGRIYQLVCAPRRRADTLARDAMAAEVLDANNQTIAGPATVDYDADRVLAGPSGVCVETDTTNWRAEVRAIDSSGFTFPVAVLNYGATQTIAHDAFVAPLYTLRLRIVCNAAGNHAFRWHLGPAI